MNIKCYCKQSMFGQQQNFQPHGFDELSANPTRHTVELMGGGKNAAQKQKRAARKRRDDRDREAAAVSGAVVKTKRKSAAAPSKGSVGPDSKPMAVDIEDPSVVAEVPLADDTEQEMASGDPVPPVDADDLMDESFSAELGAPGLDEEAVAAFQRAYDRALDAFANGPQAMDFEASAADQAKAEADSLKEREEAAAALEAAQSKKEKEFDKEMNSLADDFTSSTNVSTPKEKAVLEAGRKEAEARQSELQEKRDEYEAWVVEYDLAEGRTGMEEDDEPEKLMEMFVGGTLTWEEYKASHDDDGNIIPGKFREALEKGQKAVLGKLRQSGRLLKKLRSAMAKTPERSGWHILPGQTRIWIDPMSISAEAAYPRGEGFSTTGISSQSVTGFGN